MADRKNERLDGNAATEQAKQALAKFMVSSARRYTELQAWHRSLPPFWQDENFDETFAQYRTDDADYINMHILALGGAVPVRYIDPMDREEMNGVFTDCVGYNADGLWVMRFQDEENHQNGVQCAIAPDQLPTALKLI